MKYFKYPHPSCLLRFNSILQAGAILLIAFWTLPTMARPPGSRDNNDSIHRQGGSSSNRAAPQNFQPVRSFQRQTASQLSSSTARQVQSAPSMVLRPSNASGGQGMTVLQRSSVSTPPRQSRQEFTVPRSDAFRSMPEPRSNASVNLTRFNQTHSADNLSATPTPAVQRFSPKLPQIRRNVSAQSTAQQSPLVTSDAIQRTSVSDVRRQLGSSILMNQIPSPAKTNSVITQPTNRKIEIQQSSTPLGTHTTPRLQAISDEHSGGQTISQPARLHIQNDTSINRIQPQQNLRTRNTLENSSPVHLRKDTFTAPPAGRGNTALGNAATQSFDRQSGASPAFSQIRRHLLEQGSNKLNTPAQFGNNSNITTPNLELAPGAIKHDLNANLHNNSPLDSVRQRLGNNDRGPQRLNDLNNLTASSPVNHLNNAGPGPNIIQNPHSPQHNLRITRDDMLKSRFPDRLKSGDLDKIAKGHTAQKLKLGDQYRMMQQGDVARRMGLHNHALNVGKGNMLGPPHPGHTPPLKNVADFYVSRPYYHHGPISPHYAQSCFNFFYSGPGFFAGLCWYPHWHPWVAWSWNYYCHPFWDPRPIWCRPVIYVPYYDWVYWETPVWAPLPLAACGTWVDVQHPVVAEAQYDLQVLAVRFVDPGHPEENLGPRYRIWFRNNSDQAITKPFNLMLFAGNDNKMTADLPHAGVRITSIEAGDTQSVDVRLPISVAAMSRDAAGNPAPFEVLHVLLDSDREIEDITRTNNGAKIPRDEVLPVDPAAFEVDPSTLPVGNELVLAGEGFGPAPGQVLIQVAGQELQAEILGWYDLGVRIGVPQIDLKAPTPADVIVVRGDGAAANPIKITLLPGPAGPETIPAPEL
jgi:hypothetical protein